MLNNLNKLNVKQFEWWQLNAERSKLNDECRKLNVECWKLDVEWWKLNAMVEIEC